METTEDPLADQLSSDQNQGTFPSAEMVDPSPTPAEEEAEEEAEIEFIDDHPEDSDAFQDEPEFPGELSSAFRQSSDALASSLAFSHTTPWLARILLPILCIGCHALFYYGQTAPMWKLRTYAEIDAWANATDFISRTTFDAAGLNRQIPFHISEDRDVQTFTYSYAIDHLWKAKDLPGKLLPRLAAVLLIIFSGFWPHCKLFLLNVTWIFGKHPSRTGTLQWLSALGKWSLADVLVVCVMVGVLHLDWVVEPDDIKAGLITDLPSIIEIVASIYPHRELCDILLKMKCGKEKNVMKIAKCHTCWTLVDQAYTRPEWAQDTGARVLHGVETSGGGLATLRVQGMSGIYAFCGAVIISILLSVVVDFFDHRAKLMARKDQVQRVVQQRRQQQQHDLALEEDDPIQEPLLSEPLLSGTSPLEVDLGDYEIYQQPSNQKALLSFVLLLLTLITTIVVFLAIEFYTMERQVQGAGPMLLHDILGVDWERKYSLRSLVWTTGAAGDWDYLLTATFGLFVVVGPAFRAVLLVVVSLLDRYHLPVSGLTTFVKFIGAFCSWEVFAIAIVMVQMLMPSITNTIIDNPVCGNISDDGSCLQVEFNILPSSFAAIVIGWVLLAVVSTIIVNMSSHRSLSTMGMPSGTAGALTMAPSLDYQLLQGGGERTSEGNGLEELVFETNEF